MADSGQMTAAQMQQTNLAQRNAVLAVGVPMTQQIQSINVDPAAQPVINIQPRNVGLITGFLIEVTATLTNGATDAATRSIFGAANLVSNFTFTDLNNNQRVNCPGFLMAILNSARQGWGFGGAYANNLAMGYGNNFPVNEGPATIAASADATVRMIYYLPLAYDGGSDLRGAIYAGVVSANMNLQITLNSTPFVGATDQLNAIYTGNAAGGYKANSTVSITVYQKYIDQLPVSQGSPILPMLDLNTIYEIKYSSYNGLAVGQDFPIPYSNFRDFLSTFLVFDNGGTYNVGSDVNYFSLTSANFTNLWKITPEIAALEARQVFMADVPNGCYYFNSRRKPINTIAFGNMELNVNASTVNNGAQVLVGFEAFAQVNQLLTSAVSSLGN